MITKIDHIGIAVKSLEEAIEKYKTLGLRITKIEEVHTEKVRVAFIPCGETKIELLEPTSKESPIWRFIKKKGEGIHHIALFFEGDLKSFSEHLEDKGVCTLKKPISKGADGKAVQFIHPNSMGGVLVELVSLWKGNS